MAHIRHMADMDLPAVAEIERLCMDEPWTLDEFKILQGYRDQRFIVATVQKSVVGYVAIRVLRSRVDLLSIAVHPAYQRMHIGTELMACVRASYLIDRRARILCVASEKNEIFHFFLQSCKFRAVKVERGMFDDGSDGYKFEFRVWERIAASR